jgi:hypothetical protein
MSDYSRAALVRFLDMLEKKGLAKRNTANSLRSAASRVLQDLSPEEDADVRRVDVDLAIRRYNNRYPGTLSPDSLAEYQRRVGSAIREFEKYTDNPTSYSGIGRGVPSGKGDTPEKPRIKRAAPVQDEALALEPKPGTGGATMTGLSLSFPLRPDFLAQVVLPRDLKTEEAKRLAAFIATVAVDYNPA